MTKTKQSLDSFDWDTQAKEMDFFGEPAIDSMVLDAEEKEIKKPEKEDEEKEAEASKEEEKQDTEESLFSDLEEIQEKDEETETDTDENKSTISYKDLFTSLKSSGIISDEDLEENTEITEEVLVSKFEQSVEKRFEESIQELPDEVKNIIKFVSNGGDFYDIVSEYAGAGELDADIDMSEASNQERVLRALLEEEGKDDELIDSQIEFYKDSGKLESIATKYFDKWKENREKALEEKVSQQKAAREQALQNQKAFKKELSTFISESDSVKGFTINKKDAAELPDYISNTTVKLQDGRQITPFYRDLFETFKDKEKVVILAKLVKNGFDFSDIKKEVSTRQTKEIKNDLQRQKSNQPKEAHTKKRLVDLI